MTKFGKHMRSGAKWRLLDAKGRLFKATLITTINTGAGKTTRIAIFSVPKRHNGG